MKNKIRSCESVWNTTNIKTTNKQTYYFYKLNTLQLG